MTENKRFNSPLHSNTVIDMEHKIPSIRCVDKEQTEEFLTGLNEMQDTINDLERELSEVKTNEKQLSIDFMGFKMKLIEVLQKHLNRYTERAIRLKQPYGDVTEAIDDIADELGVDLE